MAEQLTGKSIQELSFAPLLQGSTNLIVQREGSSRAEKTTLDKITEHITTTPLLENKIKSETSLIVVNTNTSHVNANDPHGDRGYANAMLNNHLATLDPHGHKAYTEQHVSYHSSSIDPHGDRTYTNQQVANHSTSNDPHGDRQYSVEKLLDHSVALDPHGDRGYALGLILAHEYANNDPHGDRGYTDISIKSHKDESNPHGIIDKLAEFMTNHNNDLTAHGLDQKFNNLDETINTTVNNNLNQKIGTVVPPLVHGKVPKQYLSNDVVFSNYTSFPVSGEDGTLYVDTNSKDIYIWGGTTYSKVSGSGTTGTISTDIIDQGTSNDKRFYTTVIENELKSKISKVDSMGTGTSLLPRFNDKPTEIRLKSIKTEGNIQLDDLEDTLLLKTDNFNFTAKLNQDVLLSTNSNILKDITTADTIVIDGEIVAMNYQETEDMRLVKYYNSWKVQAVLATEGVSTPITPPSNIVMSANGLVITGQSVPTATIEIYTDNNVLIGTGTSLTEGSFTVVLNTPYLNGRVLKAYTVTSTEDRSEPFYFYSLNKTELKDMIGITFNKGGTKIRGNTTRSVSVVVTNSLAAVIGSGVTDTNGNFDITLTSPVITGDTIQITYKLGVKLTKTLTGFIVTLKDIEAPYNMYLNSEQTVLRGKAEPSSLITVRDGTTVLGKTSTNASGDFVLYSFIDGFRGSANTLISAEQEERRNSTAFDLSEKTVRVGDAPVVKQKVVSFSTKFLLKVVTPIIGNSVNAGLDIIYNPISKELEIQGKNKDSKVVNWIGNLKINRYSNVVKKVVGGVL